MAFHGSTQIPFERAAIIAFHPQAHGIHYTDQFLCIRIARPGRRQQILHRLLEFSCFHQIACCFNIGPGRACQKNRKRKTKNDEMMTHLKSLIVLFWVIAASPVSLLANDLPRALQPDDFIAFDAKQAQLGQLLFYDKILSGNRNISCGTCHHHDHGSSDGLSLGIGEGGIGVGPDRTAGTGADRIAKRIPRNATALWNLGAKEITALFHDGRLERSDAYENGFNSPAEEWLPKGLPNLLAAQALFPMTSQFEMAGDPKENEVAGAAYDRIDKVWPILAKRVRSLPAYAERFADAFDRVETATDITIIEIAEALAAFMGTEWQSSDSPFDAYLAGDASALAPDQKNGLDLFYGKAACSTCHSGPLLSDQKFHALALPPIGPGRTRLFDPYARDVGRMGETDDLDDAYRFRTPSLRNVTLTAPYGHNGAYPDLRGIIAHHLDAPGGLDRWQREMAHLPEAPWLKPVDFVVLDDKREMARLRSRVDIQPVSLQDDEVDDLIAFLHALEGRGAARPPLGRPESVPSGLPVD